jgi:hypothetical protein
VRVLLQSVGMEHFLAQLSHRSTLAPARAPLLGCNRHVPCPTQRTHAIQAQHGSHSQRKIHSKSWERVTGYLYITKGALDTRWCHYQTLAPTQEGEKKTQDPLNSAFLVNAPFSATSLFRATLATSAAHTSFGTYKACTYEAMQQRVARALTRKTEATVRVSRRTVGAWRPPVQGSLYVTVRTSLCSTPACAPGPRPIACNRYILCPMHLVGAAHIGLWVAARLCSLFSAKDPINSFQAA